MISPEELINDLQKELSKVKEELEQAKIDIEDFEKLAVVWKTSYLEMETKYKIKLANAEQVIEQLEEDMDEIRLNSIVS